VIAVTEEEIQRLLAAVPVSRRLQARAAIAGSADDLASRVNSVRAVPFGGWQASLSVLYLIGFAARHRPPDQVAAMAGTFGDDFGEVVLDAAATRPPAELAAITAELDRRLVGQPAAEAFLARVITRRVPDDLAGFLAALPDRGLAEKACAATLTAAPAPAVAHILLHLRGAQAREAAGQILATTTRVAPSAYLAEFLACLDGLGDADSTQAVIGTASAWQASPPGGPAVPDVDRIAELVKDLLEGGHPGLARAVVRSTLAGYARSGERYRLYALVFVFKQHGLDAEAEEVIKEISADAPDGDVIEMIIKFCQTEQPEHAAVLLRVILEKPKPDETAFAAVQFARLLAHARPVIFATVAAWRYENLTEFEERLAKSASSGWAEEFRDVVGDIAYHRDDGGDIADIIVWLLADADSKHADRRASGLRRARSLVTGTVKRGEPALMAALIGRLRESKRWWMLRDEAAALIAAEYDAADMDGLVAAAEDRCLPSVLRLVPDWLTRGPRGDAEVVRVLRRLHDAHGNPGELKAALVWSANRFRRPDGTDPMRALERADLMAERNAWFEGKRWNKPWPPRRPDPDPPP
jgi:hypothetical protein